MKKISLLSVLSIFLIASCTQEFDITPSGITYLPLIKLTGDTYVQLSCDEEFTQELYGAAAFEGGAEITLDEDIHGSYFGASTVSGPDLYIINYSAVNKDGIPGLAQRTVLKTPCTGDLSAGDISGVYVTSLKRTSAAGVVLATPQYQNQEYVYIRKVGDKYQISDAIFGWYDLGRDLGTEFIAPGVELTETSPNTFTSPQVVEQGYFGGNVSDVKLVVDPATKTIKATSSWDAGFSFEATLVQVEI